MAMLLNYRANELFYEGFQKTSLFADRTVRISAVIFILFGVITAPFKFFVPAGFKSESVSMVLLILFVFPTSTSLIGGMTRSGWKLYAGFAIFFLSGLTPALWGSPIYLFLMLPAACFLLFLLRAEPNILRCFGYSGKPFALREVLIALLLVGLFVLFSYIAVVMVTKSRFILHPSLHYLLQFLIVVPEYFVAWGIMYGVLMKRLLELKFEPLVSILVNIVLTLFWWFSAALNANNPGMVFAGVFAWAIAVQLILGMAYYFARTTRPLLFAFALNTIVFVYSSTT